MSRSVLLLSLATLSLLASCVDLRLPSKVSQCEKNDNCSDGTGGATGGKGGTTAKSGGSTARSADAGVDTLLGGKGGSGGTVASTGGTSGGASGGDTTGGSTGGTGGAVTGGSSGSPDAGADLMPDVAIDKPVVNSDVPIDTESKLDTLVADTNKTGPEVGPEPGPDAPSDLPVDRLPDRPDTATDGPTCIQSFKSNGYAVSSSDGGIKACSECKTSSGNSLENYCKGMIDCLVTAWVCNSRSATCWTNCRNNTPGADMVVDDCAAALVSRACP